jgi:hypothetical protein
MIDASHPFVTKRVRECKSDYAIKGPMLCSGITIGTRETMLEFFEIMYQEMIQWMIEQNYFLYMVEIKPFLYYSGKLDGINPTIFLPSKRNCKYCRSNWISNFQIFI